MPTISLQELKTSLETALTGKADKSGVYTKGEVNTVVSGKADSTSVYTKVETDNKLDQIKLSQSTLTVTAVGGESQVNIPFADFASSKDALFVYQQNIPLLKGINYDITSDSKKIVFLDYTLEAGEVIAFVMVRYSKA